MSSFEFTMAEIKPTCNHEKRFEECDVTFQCIKWKDHKGDHLYIGGFMNGL